MKEIVALLTLSIALMACLDFDVRPENNYQIKYYNVKVNQPIYDVSNVTFYKSSILLVSKNKVYGLNPIHETISEYQHDLGEINEVILFGDSMVFVSKDTLYAPNSLSDGRLTFEKYDYVDSTRPYHSEATFYTEEFIISSCSRGEWGGTVFFENINDKEIYSMPTNSLFNVDTLHGDIYLFNFLPHLNTFTSVYQVGNVRSLMKISKNYECNWYNQLYAENGHNQDSISKLLMGDEDRNRVVFDTIGMPILHGFIDDQDVKLIRIEKNKLQLLTIAGQNKVKVSSILAELDTERRIRSKVWNHRNNTIISCSDSSSSWNDNSPMKLTHLVNINKEDRIISVYEIN